MAKNLCSFDNRDLGEWGTVCGDEAAQEYFRGEFWIEHGSTQDVRAERRTVGAASIIRQRSAAMLFFRRSPRHIADDGSDLSIVWFVESGELAASDPRGDMLARQGDVIVTRSTFPFTVECRMNGGGVHEALHLVVPTRILHAVARRDFGDGPVMAIRSSELAIAHAILVAAFDADRELEDPSAWLLVETALALVGHAVAAAQPPPPIRVPAAERRLDEVLRFIEAHLGDPQLSATMVARGCGISPRYVSCLLRLRDTSFSNWVWDRRLARAQEWLATSDPRDISIGAIAQGVGFKSPAHFSRMFKRVFGANPRNYRGERAIAACRAGPLPRCPDAAELLQCAAIGQSVSMNRQE